MRLDQLYATPPPIVRFSSGGEIAQTHAPLQAALAQFQKYAMDAHIGPLNLWKGSGVVTVVYKQSASPFPFLPLDAE